MLTGIYSKSQYILIVDCWVPYFPRAYVLEDGSGDLKGAVGHCIVSLISAILQCGMLPQDDKPCVHAIGCLSGLSPCHLVMWAQAMLTIC